MSSTKNKRSQNELTELSELIELSEFEEVLSERGYMELEQGGTSTPSQSQNLILQTEEPLTPPSTKNLSKSARNRIYAQTSRARHRAYVSNLERDREMLLERLERIEAENLRMARELEELRCKRIKHELDGTISNESNKVNKINNVNSSDPYPYSHSHSAPITHTPYNHTPYNRTHTPYSHTLNTHDFSTSSQYALSVLDSSPFPTDATNSPRPWSPAPKVPLLNILVAVASDFSGRETQMNWKRNCYGMKRNLSLMRRRWRMRVLEIIKLAKLKIYLQQFGRQPLKGIPVVSETSSIRSPSRLNPETTCPRLELIPRNSTRTPLSPLPTSSGNLALSASSTSGTAFGAVLAAPLRPTDPDDNLNKSRPGGEETAM